MAKNNPLQNNSKPKVAPISQSKKPISKTSNSGSLFKIPQSSNTEILFDKINYILIGIGGILIILGFIFMSGGNQDPKVFNEAELYSFRRITLAPITILLGFLLVAIAILKKPNSAINSLEV